MRRRVLSAALATAAALVWAAVPTAGAATDSTTTASSPADGSAEPIAPSWVQVTDDTGRNIDEVALARTTDGTVHVLWRQRLGALKEQITHTPLVDGRPGTPSVASGPWASAGNPAVVVTEDGGLRIVFPGLTGTDHARDGMQSASSDATGSSWSTDPTRVSNTESAIGEGVAAALPPDGTLTYAFAYSFVLGLHFGLNPADPDTDLLPGNACCGYHPGIAYDSTGSGLVGWYSNVDGEEGLWVQEVGPPPGATTQLPGSVTDGKSLPLDQRMPITSRPGEPGIWAAYCSGYPTCTEVLLWNDAASTPVTVAPGEDVENVNIAAADDGRLWVMWEDARTRTLHAVRTDPDASELGAVVTFSPPEGTTTVWNLQGIASDDGLDVFAAVDTGDVDAATWHAEVRPGLRVQQSGSKKRTVLRVTDAGAPVKGARVRAGKTTLTTDKKGRTEPAKLTGTVKVTKAGYSPASYAVG